MATERKRYTHAEWLAEAERRFGADPMMWSFVCPVCKHVASVADYKAAGATEGAVAFSCVGRYLPNPRNGFGKTGTGPCNYTGGGLFQLNPVDVALPEGGTRKTFDFAEVPASG